MERNESDGVQSNIGGEQTSFGGELNSRTESGAADQNAATGATSRIKGVASSVKEKASNLPALLADGLEAGAQKLRQQKSALATTEGSTAISQDSSVTAITDSLATGMQSSADWLREADIEKLKTGVETQVKEHPARTLLIALGAGYVLGKVFRR
jgi:hypothetical protein